MSRKKKAMRAFLFQNPEATRTECWDAAWANEQSRVSSLKYQELEAQLAELRESIKPRECAKCQGAGPERSEEL